MTFTNMTRIRHFGHPGPDRSGNGAKRQGGRKTAEPPGHGALEAGDAVKRVLTPLDDGSMWRPRKEFTRIYSNARPGYGGFGEGSKNISTCTNLYQPVPTYTNLYKPVPSGGSRVGGGQDRAFSENDAAGRLRVFDWAACFFGRHSST